MLVQHHRKIRVRELSLVLAARMRARRQDVNRRPALDELQRRSGWHRGREVAALRTVTEGGVDDRAAGRGERGGSIVTERAIGAGAELRRVGAVRSALRRFDAGKGLS